MVVICISLLMSDVEHLFICFFSYLYVFLGELSNSLAHFSIGSFIFLELSWRSCLYIFEINPLFVASFALLYVFVAIIDIFFIFCTINKLL